MLENLKLCSIVLYSRTKGVKRRISTVYSTLNIYENFFRTFLGDGYGEMTRINYFGGFDSDNVCRNLSLNIVSFLFKFYIWSCKLRFRLPGEGESVDFAKSHISNFFNLDRNFRETWTKSGIDFRF